MPADNVPKVDEDMLFVDCDGMYYLGFYDFCHGYFYDERGDICDAVLYWMPVPPLPRPQDNTGQDNWDPSVPLFTDEDLEAGYKVITEYIEALDKEK